MEFYVYILRSKLDGSYYIGYTTDMGRRLDEHNNGLSRYTSKKIPWELVYTEQFQKKSEALKRERFLKSQRNRSFYERLIKGEVG
jgi:putative endonuclease